MTLRVRRMSSLPCFALVLSVFTRAWTGNRAAAHISKPKRNGEEGFSAERRASAATTQCCPVRARVVVWCKRHIQFMIACVHSQAALGGPPVTLGAQRPTWRFPLLLGVNLKHQAFVAPPVVLRTNVCDVEPLHVRRMPLKLCFCSRFGSEQLGVLHFRH